MTGAVSTEYEELQAEHGDGRGHERSGTRVESANGRDRPAGCNRLHPEDFPGEDGAKPPHDADAERALLGDLLQIAQDPPGERPDVLEASESVYRDFTPTDFYIGEHSTIFAALLALHERGVATDITTLHAELKRRGKLDSIGGKPFLVQLVTDTPSSANVTHHAEIVLRHARNRGVAGGAAVVRRGALAGDEAAVQAAIDDIERVRRRGAPAASRVQECVDARAVLAPEAYRGLPGDWWSIVDPCTEASPAAVVATFYCIAGAIIGPRPYFEVGPGDRHHANEFVLVVGDTGAGVKGTALKAAREPFERIAPDFFADCVFAGSNSSAGIIHAIRDPVWRDDPAGGGQTKVDDGCRDAQKRALFTLTEYGALLRTFERQADTTSQTWRDLWDSVRVQNISKTNAAASTGHHVALLGHCTPSELRSRLDSKEVLSGFANRHVAIWSERSKLLPNPPKPNARAVEEFCDRLRAAVEFGSGVDEMRRDADTTALWTAIYPDLVTLPGGILGALLERGRAHIVRMSMIAALLDGSSTIRVEHLLTALAFHDYSAATWVRVFGDSTGDAQADRFVRTVIDGGGRMLHSDLHDALGRNWRAQDYERVIAHLQGAGRLCVETSRTGGSGRPGTLYVVTRASAVAPVLPKARAILAGGAA